MMEKGPNQKSVDIKNITFQKYDILNSQLDTTGKI